MKVIIFKDLTPIYFGVKCKKDSTLRVTLSRNSVLLSANRI